MGIGRTELNRETLAEQVARKLMAYIESRNIKPGDVLPSESKLIIDFGVSRPVIREALKSLKALGVIDIVNGKGAVVRSVNSDVLSGFFQWAVRVKQGTLLQLLEVRKGVEVQSASLAAQRRTPEDLAEMASVAAAMRQHLHNPDAYSELDVKLHLQIASAARNAMLYHLVESIRGPSQVAIREGLRRRSPDEQQLERVQVLHEDLLAALEKGDSREAEQAMSRHFDEAVVTMMTGAKQPNIW